MASQYIQFNETRIGKDGRTYYSGIKYRIVKDDDTYIYLNGLSKEKPLNRFLKEEINRKSLIGNIIGR